MGVMGFFQKKRSRAKCDLPAEKRISTPAGARLSVIMESGNGAAKNSRTGDSHRSSWRKSGVTASYVVEVPQSTPEEQTGGVSSNIWSEPTEETPRRSRLDRCASKIGGWKKCAFVTATVIIVVVAVVVGLLVGLKKKTATPKPNEAATTGASSTITSAATSTSSSAATASSVPSGFPLGNYSMLTFLDTVQTDCTSDADTWTCYPGTIYNDDDISAAVDFAWMIASNGESSYQISSAENAIGINFKDEPLELVDEGEDTEHYRLQVMLDKTVVLNGSLTDDGSSATCFLNSTTFQAYLYTKASKDYPSTSEASEITVSNQEWPYRVRVEQVIGGGDNVPNCYKSENGTLGDAITDGLEAMDAGSLCSCLYRNYLTPDPNDT